MLKPILCDYTFDACIRFKGTIIIIAERAEAAARQPDDRNKGVIIKTVHHSLTA